MEAMTHHSNDKDMGDRIEQHDVRTLPWNDIRFRVIFERAAIGIALADMKGQLLEINTALCTLLGYTRQEMNALMFNDFTHPDDVTLDMGLYRQLIAGQRTSYAVEKRFIRRDQHIIWGRLTASLVRDQVGTPQFVVAMLEDITAHKKDKEALLESEERFHDAFTYAATGMALVGIDGRLLKVNQAFCEIVGYAEEDLLRKTFQSLTHADDLDADFVYRHQLLRGEKRYYHREKRYYHKRGHIVWVQLSVSLVRDSQDEPLYFVAQVQDITERRYIEAELRQSEERYRLLAENTSDLVGLHGLDGRWTYVSPSCQALLGFQPAELEGANIFDLLHPNDKEHFTRFHKALIEGNEPPPITYRIRTKSGEYTWFETMARAIRGSFGHVINTETSSRDVSKRVKTSQELARQARKLARSNADLEQFAYIASHDLQEPLATMIGYLQLLQRRYGDKLDADADEYIAYAIDGATRMQALINDLLAYSRVNTRGTSFEQTDCNQVLQHALANLTAAIEQSGALIHHTALPSLVGDATQLTSLFQNLISNAIKFRNTTHPEITIGVERQNGDWLFSVRDNGIGIDMEQAETIFRVFQRSERGEHYPGTGIGLAVCKKIVERHGGRIWVESQPQHGSTFFFTIPDATQQKDE